MDAESTDRLKVTLWVDALAPQPGGIGRYTLKLCEGLATHPDVRGPIYFGRGRLIDDPGSLLRSEALPRLRRGLGWWRRWNQQRQLNGTLVHGPNYFLPPFAEEGVITVHDLSVLLYPETHPVERVQAFEAEFQHTLGRATHIITDTETVRQEVMRAFSVPADRITAVHLGVDDRFRPFLFTQLLHKLQPLGLQPWRYALCVSTLEPRKKIEKLVDAWRQLPVKLRTEYPLVLAGGAGWSNEALREQIAAAVAEGWLIHLGFVDDDALPQLYAGAAIFAYPSIYEGFGLPPLEAMACGAPVVVSNRSCLPEISGDVARYIDPEDVDSFTAVLQDCLEDKGWRQQAAKAGVERAGAFSWARCIDETVGVYRKSLNGKTQRAA